MTNPTRSTRIARTIWALTLILAAALVAFAVRGML